MKRLLYVKASPRGERSRSGAIADRLLDGLREARPGLEVETLELFEADLPAFDREAIEGRYARLVGGPVEPEQALAWGRLEEWGAHFLSFDAWLFAVPMWNFGVPYRLKQYIDVLTHPGITFRNDLQGNVEGLAAGRTAIIVAAGAMPIEADGPLAHLDFQLTYLQAWLGFIGVSDIHALRLAPTFGPVEAVDAVMDEAGQRAERLARALALGGAGID